MDGLYIKAKLALNNGIKLTQEITSKKLPHTGNLISSGVIELEQDVPEAIPLGDIDVAGYAHFQNVSASGIVYVGMMCEGGTEYFCYTALDPNESVFLRISGIPYANTDTDGTNLQFWIVEENIDYNESSSSSESSVTISESSYSTGSSGSSESLSSGESSSYDNHVYTVTGTDNVAESNGTYTYAGDYNGKQSYANSNGFYLWFDGSIWICNAEVGTKGAGYYPQVSGTADNPIGDYNAYGTYSGGYITVA